MTTQCEHLHIINDDKKNELNTINNIPMFDENGKCNHRLISFDKLNDCNYCEDCMDIFLEDEYILEREEEIDKDVIDESERNLARLNRM